MGGAASQDAQWPARFLSPDKNTFLWAQELAAWPQLKTFPVDGSFIHILAVDCFVYKTRAEHVCSLWVVFGQVTCGKRTPYVPLR